MVCFLNINNSMDPILLGKREIKIVKLLGEGAYGRVYLTDLDNIVIKIFLSDEHLTKINMEYKIFKKLIDYSTNCDEFNFRDSLSGSDSYPTNLVRALGRGELISDFTHNGFTHKKGERFILTPLYKKFYNVNKSSTKLRDNDFIIDFMSILLKVCVFLEKKLRIVNMDIKTSNLMYQNKDLILIDLGLIQNIETGKEIYVPDKKYFIWPNDSCFIITIPVYSIAICVIEFFFGKLKVWKINSKNEVNKLVDLINKKTNKVGSILKKMISLKYDPITILKYIEVKYRSELDVSDKELDIPNKNIESPKIKRKKKKKKRPVNKWYSNLLTTVNTQGQNAI